MTNTFTLPNPGPYHRLCVSALPLSMGIVAGGRQGGPCPPAEHRAASGLGMEGPEVGRACGNQLRLILTDDSALPSTSWIRVYSEKDQALSADSSLPLFANELIPGEATVLALVDRIGKALGEVSASRTHL